MTTFVMLTCSFTVAILLASAVMTVVMYKLALSAKFMKWFTKKYMKTINDVMKDMESMMFEEMDA